jgi:hypothetical protein
VERHVQTSKRVENEIIRTLFINTVMGKKVSVEISTDDALSEIEIKEALEYYGWKDVLNEIQRQVGASDIIEEMGEDEAVDFLIDNGYKVEKE